MIILKNARELDQMRAACKLSAEALWEAERFMKPGVSTWEIDEAIRKFIVAAGAKPSFLGLYDFPGSACISINQQVIHGIPSKSVFLKEGDIVSIDTGAYYEGFHGDNAYTFGVGAVAEDLQELLRVTEECLYRGIDQAKAGRRIGDISHAVQTHAEAHGYGVVRPYVGHGVGKDLHEDPEVPNYGTPGRGVRLVPGMTIAIEPMINLNGDRVKTLSDGTVETVSGSPSAHFEHTVAITGNGAEILTARQPFGYSDGRR